MIPTSRSVLLLFALVGAAAPLSSCADAGACSSDSECETGRVCASGVCVDPRWTDGGQPPVTGHGGSGGGGTGGTGPIQTGLGAVCDNPCNGTWCSSGGSGIDSICVGSDLSLPCVGTSAGMYCSHSCAMDSDCSNPIRAMSCLVTCPKDPAAAQQCWTTSAAEFLRTQVCGS